MANNREGARGAPKGQVVVFIDLVEVTQRPTKVPICVISLGKKRRKKDSVPYVQSVTAAARSGGSSLGRTWLLSLPAPLFTSSLGAGALGRCRIWPPPEPRRA